MQTKKLYVLISDNGDGSCSPRYTLNPELIKKMEAAYDDGRMGDDTGIGIGIDGDGFHYSTINVPADSTPESLGIFVIDDDYVEKLNEWS